MLLHKFSSKSLHHLGLDKSIICPLDHNEVIELQEILLDPLVSGPELIVDDGEIFGILPVVLRPERIVPVLSRCQEIWDRGEMV